MNDITDRANYANMGIKKTLPTRTQWSTTIPGWEDREFYQAKTVKTHSNNLVVLTYVQLKSFYRLSTVFLPVTSLTWGNVPGPLLLYCTASDGKLGEGLGMRLWNTWIVLQNTRPVVQIESGLVCTCPNNCIQASNWQWKSTTHTLVLHLYVPLIM